MEVVNAMKRTWIIGVLLALVGVPPASAQVKCGSDGAWVSDATMCPGGQVQKRVQDLPSVSRTDTNAQNKALDMKTRAAERLIHELDEGANQRLQADAQRWKAEGQAGAQRQADEAWKRDVDNCTGIAKSSGVFGAKSFDAYVSGSGRVQMVGSPKANYEFQKCMTEAGHTLK